MRPDLNYKDLASELLPHLRGKRSQAYLNQKLGFSSNQVYRWEKGLRSIDWSDFIKTCKILNMDLGKVFQIHFGYQGKNLEGRYIVKHLLGNLSMKEAVKATSFSRSMLTKWLAGTTSPHLHHILQLLECPNHVLLVFIREIVGHGKVKSLEQYENFTQNLKDFYYQEPVVAGVVSLLETSRFHSKKELTQGIAHIFQLEEAKVHEILKRMVEIGIISEHEKFWRIEFKDFDTRGSFEGSKKVRTFWYSKALNVLQNLTSPEMPHLFPFFVFNVSEEGSHKLREAHYRYVSQLKAIVEEDKGDKKFVRAITISDIEY